jgi:hypothetical protein
METALRQLFAERLRALGTTKAATFADEIVDAALPEGPLCWGHLVDRFEALFPSDGDRLSVLPALITAGDLGALLLFLDLCRDRPTVLAAIAKEAPRLPFTVQCALASMPETRTLLSSAPALHHAAAAIVAGDDALRAREHAVYSAHMSALRSHRTRAPKLSVATSTQVPEAHTPGDPQ